MSCAARWDDPSGVPPGPPSAGTFGVLARPLGGCRVHAPPRDDRRCMTDPDRHPLRPTTPGGLDIAPPKPFVDRRRRTRRAADRLADEETRLLAMALDALAADRPAEARLADLLDLLADTVGATRTAVIADGEARRIAVAASGPDELSAATELATWLDATAPRSGSTRHRCAAEVRRSTTPTTPGFRSPRQATSRSASPSRERPTPPDCRIGCPLRWPATQPSPLPSSPSR